MEQECLEHQFWEIKLETNHLVKYNWKQPRHPSLVFNNIVHDKIHFHFGKYNWKQPILGNTIGNNLDIPFWCVNIARDKIHFHLTK
jgi:hypothetical protein